MVQLLTALKLDTGYDDPTADITPACNADMEFDIRQPNASTESFKSKEQSKQPSNEPDPFGTLDGAWNPFNFD